MSPAVRASSHIWFFCNSKISNRSSSGTATGRPIVRMVVEATSWTNDANLRVQRNKCWRILKQWHKANFRWIGSIRLCVSSAPTPFFLYSPNEVYLLLSEKHEIDFCYRSERESFKRETNWQEKKAFAKERPIVSFVRNGSHGMDCLRSNQRNNRISISRRDRKLQKQHT